ncbi:MAG TPA: NAD(P)H-dependent glycerol-3-phosphate dehydrogenase [Rubrivivax sp.]|nr:NAD(P)H-dependent glycerol-3-phosphate dehydrogenase [Rubrivivax sp.]
MNISLLGAGAWGSALAVATAPRHDTLLWTRDARQAQQMIEQRRNHRYLPEVALPGSLHITADHGAALRHACEGLLVIATPMSALRERLSALPPHMPALWLCKGFESGSGALGHEIARELRPHAAAGVLSGPSFALEVAREQPTALVAASTDAGLCDAAVQAFHSDTLRVYRSADPIGVEVGGAVKNVLAIATGLVDGLAAHADVARRPGLNARAALVTRGLAEMTRLGVALGARAETFMGLSGLGDLVLTATGDLSRNRRVGLLLAQGLALRDILAQLGHVAEGVYSAPMVLARAFELGVQMPITQAVVEVLDGRVEPVHAMWQLMSREATSEH